MELSSAVRRVSEATIRLVKAASSSIENIPMETIQGRIISMESPLRLAFVEDLDGIVAERCKSELDLKDCLIHSDDDLKDDILKRVEKVPVLLPETVDIPGSTTEDSSSAEEVSEVHDTFTKPDVVTEVSMREVTTVNNATNARQSTDKDTQTDDTRPDSNIPDITVEAKSNCDSTTQTSQVEIETAEAMNQTVHNLEDKASQISAEDKIFIDKSDLEKITSRLIALESKNNALTSRIKDLQSEMTIKQAQNTKSTQHALHYGKLWKQEALNYKLENETLKSKATKHSSKLTRNSLFITQIIENIPIFECQHDANLINAMIFKFQNAFEVLGIASNESLKKKLFLGKLGKNGVKWYLEQSKIHGDTSIENWFHRIKFCFATKGESQRPMLLQKINQTVLDYAKDFKLFYGDSEEKKELFRDGLLDGIKKSVEEYESTSGKVLEFMDLVAMAVSVEKLLLAQKEIPNNEHIENTGSSRREGPSASGESSRQRQEHYDRYLDQLDLIIPKEAMLKPRLYTKTLFTQAPKGFKINMNNKIQEIKWNDDKSLFYYRQE